MSVGIDRSRFQIGMAEGGGNKPAHRCRVGALVRNGSAKRNRGSIPAQQGGSPGLSSLKWLGRRRRRAWCGKAACHVLWEPGRATASGDTVGGEQSPFLPRSFIAAHVRPPTHLPSHKRTCFDVTIAPANINYYVIAAEASASSCCLRTEYS